MIEVQRKGLPIKVTGILVAVVLSVIVYMTMYDSKSEPRTFRGIQWGGNIEGLPGMTLVAEDGDMKFYSRADDRMKLGDVTLDKLVYGFYKGRFYNVMMYFTSSEGFSEAENVLLHQYGEPYQPSQTGSAYKYYWEADNVGILLTYDEASHTGRVSYIYKPIESELGDIEPPVAKGSGS